MKRLFMIFVCFMFSFNIVNAEEQKEGFYYFGKEVPMTFYGYNDPVPIYDVNGYSVTARVYLDQWYNLGSTKTWNSIANYNGMYELTINFTAIEPNTCSDIYIAVQVNKGTMTNATFDFYNVLDELDTSVGTSSINLSNGVYFIWSDAFKSPNTITKVIVTIDFTSGTGSHTYEVTGINIFPNDYCTPDEPDDPEVDTTPNDQIKEELDNVIDNYEDLENTFIDNFNNNLSNIDTNLDILSNNDFLKTSTFLSTQIQTIYNSNDYIKYMLTFGLVLGIAFTLIGIKLRR